VYVGRRGSISIFWNCLVILGSHRANSTNSSAGYYTCCGEGRNC